VYSFRLLGHDYSCTRKASRGEAVTSAPALTRATQEWKSKCKNTPIDPEYINYVGDAIVVATGDLFDDFEVVRKIARAAIEAVASK
jgi:hypothetical protein